MGCPNIPVGINIFNIETKEHNGRPSRGAIACMINSEIGAVLAVMRRNVRWGVRYMEDDDQLEHPLIQSLKELRKQIFSWQHHWHRIKPIMYLQPFLDVIKSDETGAPITGVALSSIYKILSLDILNLQTVNVEDAIHFIVDAVTSCRFEVTDPASEEVVLMKILQVLLACMKSKASIRLSNQHVCNIVNTCFRIVHQASSKGELLQRIARQTMHELVRCIFLHVHDIDSTEHTSSNGSISHIDREVVVTDGDPSISNKQTENADANTEQDGQLSNEIASNSSSSMLIGKEGESKVGVMTEPYGIECMLEIFHFLCSLLNATEPVGIGSKSNPMAYDEDVPLFALGLINSAIELSGTSIRQHPKLLALIQDELFRNLMQFGLSRSPLILSMVYSIVLNMYHHLRTDLKLQLEAFFSCVLLRVAQGKHGASYQQQEVAMEALVDLCRQPTFTTEMYANFDCDISCSNVFEELASLLSRSAFPVNVPLSAMHILALNGLTAMIQGISERVERVSIGFPKAEDDPFDSEGYKALWVEKCENFDEPNYWIPFVRKMKYFKKKLLIGSDHFNRDPKKGLEFAQGMKLLPDELNPKSVACFFRLATGLDKFLIGDYLGNHDKFCIRVLHEFAGTFDFQDINLDTALRIFLETFRLPGESQKIQRVLEAFAERYYEQSPQILINKDAALLLSYSIIMLNTDQHNPQVKKKMTEEDFIRNNRRINGGNDLPREYISELYRSICENEIRIATEQNSNSLLMTSSRWISLVHQSRKSTPYIVCDSIEHLDYDMFSVLSGSTIAAICVVFDHVEHEHVLQTCIDGFLGIAKISACYRLHDVLDDLVVSLCKITTLLSPSCNDSHVNAFGDDAKARMATITMFGIVNKYGDYIRSGWKNVLDCILSLHKLNLLPDHFTSGDLAPAYDSESSKPTRDVISYTQSISTPKKSSGLMGRFSQLLSFDTEELVSQPTEEEVAARQHTLLTVENCRIDIIFTESKFLQADSLLQLLRAMILGAGRIRKGNYPLEDEATAVFWLELVIAVTVNNRDRIMLIWQDVYEHLSNIMQSIVMPCVLVEKAVFGLVRICRRLLPYKQNLSDELLKSLQLILKLDARVADAYCEQITQEVTHLVKANAAHIKSHVGWRAIVSLLSITARHPEAAESGFEALSFIMSDGAHLLPANYVICMDAASEFSESWVGQDERSVTALNLMSDSVVCLVRWSREAKRDVEDEAAAKLCQNIGEMWLRLACGLKKVCLDRRFNVRNHALAMLQQCLIGADGIRLPIVVWSQCYDMVIFTLLDDLLEIVGEKPSKDYRNMEGTIVLALKLLSKVFLQFLHDISQLPTFCKIWVGVLNRTEGCMNARFRGRKSEKIHELVPELLKNTLLVMKSSRVALQTDAFGGDSFWQLTWLHVNNIDPSLQSKVFPNDLKTETFMEVNM